MVNRESIPKSHVDNTRSGSELSIIRKTSPERSWLASKGFPLPNEVYMPGTPGRVMATVIRETYEEKRKVMQSFQDNVAAIKAVAAARDLNGANHRPIDAPEQTISTAETPIIELVARIGMNNAVSVVMPVDTPPQS